MTERHGPLKDDGGRATSSTATKRSPQPTSTDPIPTGRREQFDALAAYRRRRESALRLDGSQDPDPLHPGRRHHRPSTGLRASGYREGYAAALRWLLREHSAHINELLRAKVAAMLNRVDGA